MDDRCIVARAMFQSVTLEGNAKLIQTRRIQLTYYLTTVRRIVLLQSTATMKRNMPFSLLLVVCIGYLITMFGYGFPKVERLCPNGYMAKLVSFSSTLF